MILSQQDALVMAVADLRAADVLLSHAVAELRTAQRHMLAETTSQMAAAVASWAALLQAQHERLATHTHTHKR